MTTMSGWRFFFVGLTLAWAGCYQDLDYSHIKCDVTAESPCPDGFVCNADGLCVNPNAVDAPLSEDGPSMADALPSDQPPLDAPTEASATADVISVVDTATNRAPDGASADKPGEVSGGRDGGVSEDGSMTPPM